jgi:carbon monoxide dehydrogenase subunit G
MNHLAEEVTIAGTPDEVWSLLCDPVLVVSCIPGATLVENQQDDSYRGTFKVKFGPTVVIFRGEATLSYDHDGRRCTIESRGVDQRGASRAVAGGIVAVTGSGPVANLGVTGDFHITGPLESFARTGGVHVARVLLGEFSTNLARLIGERREPAASGTSPSMPPPSDAPSPSDRRLNGIILIWHALLGWLREVVNRRREGTNDRSTRT